VQLNGVVGIPAGDETSYFQKAYNASKELIDNGPHSLYNAYPDDPMLNHKQLFVDEIENNPEVIFTERYDAASTFGTNLSTTAVHADFAFSWNSNFRPYLDIAEKFEFADGSSGFIPHDQYAAKEWTMDELFHNRDPRFKAALLLMVLPLSLVFWPMEHLPRLPTELLNPDPNLCDKVSY
jgi:hypothetical protein